MMTRMSNLFAGVYGIAGAGKSTLVSQLAPRPLLVLDADSRFNEVAELQPGEVEYWRGGVLTEPLRTAEALIELDGSPLTIIFDSLTGMYELHARVASMAGRLSSQQREARGMAKNKAALMMDKADAIAVARMAVTYAAGGDVYYIWHTNFGIDGQGQAGERPAISDTELKRLERAVNIKMECEFLPGTGYVTHVRWARSIGGRQPNLLTLADPKKSYWRGANVLRSLVHAHFAGPKEATDWATGQVESLDEPTAKDWYESVKEEHAPPTARAMWVRWVFEVLKKQEPHDLVLL